MGPSTTDQDRVAIEVMQTLGRFDGGNARPAHSNSAVRRDYGVATQTLHSTPPQLSQKRWRRSRWDFRPRVHDRTNAHAAGLQPRSRCVQAIMIAEEQDVGADANASNTLARFYVELLGSMCLYASGAGLLLAFYVAWRAPAVPRRSDAGPPVA